jgi:hypothetical protein
MGEEEGVDTGSFLVKYWNDYDEGDLEVTIRDEDIGFSFIGLCEQEEYFWVKKEDLKKLLGV